jgi:hypothetical protein
MSRRAAGWVIASALILLAGAAAWWWSTRRDDGRPAGLANSAQGRATKVELNLYFPADGGLLRPERRVLPLSEAPKQRIRGVVEALLAGPQAEGLYPLLPETVTVGSVQLGGDGTAYIDLRSPELETPPPAGSTAEMQIVYSIVDSVVWNVPQARQVVLLWNGVQPLTFAGHLDLSGPLMPNRRLVAAAEARR